MLIKTGVYWCLLASGCLAQTGSLEGELSTQKPGDLSHLVVRLETANHYTAAQTVVNTGGDFRFRHIDLGNYTLVVTDDMGHEITRMLVTILATNPPVRLDLPEPRGAAYPGGIVSVSQLRHRPAPGARKAAVKAQKLSGAGDYQGAAAQLEKAVALDPQYADAYGNLGAQYVRLHQPGRAVAAFRQAVALDPSSAPEEANLALALGLQHQPDEAVRFARRALQIDSTNALAHYVLGCILAADAATKTEAIHHLEVASHDLPAAAKALEALPH